ncbi:hypothetical protein BNJ_00305 [Kaumoebavirus]|uniref:hypothetical protein n=1 Tax=Kaumoebavirus TaxID=1859492 RepID=UPI0009C3DC0D|nr:hypothetical protein BNJ_00305 [Kaumoebavirus]ARA72127.1 hypothetical protein BNJ_00305 [Kaumoebavirus]
MEEGDARLAATGEGKSKHCSESDGGRFRLRGVIVHSLFYQDKSNFDCSVGDCGGKEEICDSFTCQDALAFDDNLDGDVDVPANDYAVIILNISGKGHYFSIYLCGGVISQKLSVFYGLFFEDFLPYIEMNAEKCQSLISGIIGQMTSGRPVCTIMLTRAIMQTTICDSHELSDLREAYKSYIGEETVMKLAKFEDLTTKETLTVRQASLHYGTWTKRAMINGLNFSGKCALLTAHPLQYLRAIIAPISGGPGLGFK